jgi:hypothetical protein
MMSTTTTIGNQIHENELLAVTGVTTAGAGSVTVAEAVLSVAGDAAASATGVLDVCVGLAATCVATAAGVDVGLR